MKQATGTDLVQSVSLFFSRDFDVAKISIISIPPATFNEHPRDGLYVILSYHNIDAGTRTSHFTLPRTPGQQLHSSRGMSILNYLSIKNLNKEKLSAVSKSIYRVFFILAVVSVWQISDGGFK
jgi:hypothetical protein